MEHSEDHSLRSFGRSLDDPATPYPEPEDIPVVPLPPLVGPPDPPPDAGVPEIPLPPIVGVPDRPSPQPPVYPGPGSQVRNCRVRILHAAPQEGSLTVSVGPARVAANLGFGNFSRYTSIPDGFRTVTVMTSRVPRTVLLRRTIPFHAGDVITLAVINNQNGIELTQISDRTCLNRPAGLSCLRMSNLTLNSPPLDLLLCDGRVVFSDVRYKETTPHTRVRPGYYSLLVTQTPSTPLPRFRDVETLEELPLVVGERYLPGYGELVPLASVQLRVRANRAYTLYILGDWGDGQQLQVLVGEE